MTFEYEATLELSKSLWRNDEFAEARRVLLPLVREARHAHSIIGLHNLLSIYEDSMGRRREAVRIIEACAPWVGDCRDDVLAGKFHHTYGVAKQRGGRYEEAFAAFERAIELHTKGGAFSFAAQTRGNVGQLLIDLGQPAEGLIHVERGIAECRRPEITGQMLDSKARGLLALGRFDGARRAAYESIEVLEGVGDVKAFLDESYRTLGLIDYAEARVRVNR